MASWTELNTTYTAYTPITTELWNELSGADGNLQYLYDVLEQYGFQDYYAYGFYNAENTAFINLTAPDEYDLESYERVDERPDGIDPQFYDEENYANIQIQKSGLYLLNAHALPINATNNQPETGFTLKFQKNEVDISQTATSISNGQSVTADRLATPNPLNYFAIDLLNQDDVVTPTILANNTGYNGTLYQYTGSWASSQMPYAKSPYVSALFLSTTQYSTGTDIIYFFEASSKYFPAINNEYFNKIKLYITSPSPIFDEPPWTSVNEPNDIIFYGAKYLDSNFWWNIAYDSPTISYCIPPEFEDAIYINELAIWRIIRSYEENIDYRYFLFAFKSLDYYNPSSMSVSNYETNIISFCIYDEVLQGLKSVVCTLSVSYRNEFLFFPGGGAVIFPVCTFWLRTYGLTKKIEFLNMPPNDAAVIGLEFQRLYNNEILYEPSFIFNNQKIATEIGNESKLIYGPTDGYDLSNIIVYNYNEDTPKVYTNDITQVNAVFMQGPDFITGNGTTNKRAGSAMYATGNWRLSDEYTESVNNAAEKLLVWNQMVNSYNITDATRTPIVSSLDVSSIITIGTYDFDDTGRLI